MLLAGLREFRPEVPASAARRARACYGAHTCILAPASPLFPRFCGPHTSNLQVVAVECRQAPGESPEGGPPLQWHRRTRNAACSTVATTPSHRFVGTPSRVRRSREEEIEEERQRLSQLQQKQFESALGCLAQSSERVLRRSCFSAARP